MLSIYLYGNEECIKIIEIIYFFMYNCERIISKNIGRHCLKDLWPYNVHPCFSLNGARWELSLHPRKSKLYQSRDNNET